MIGATGAGWGVARAAAAAPQESPRRYEFFSEAEARFMEAAIARLIPADELGPGALEAGVAEFIDSQLAGAWGGGERLYRSGPWRAGEETQGYQLPFTPAQLFRNAIRAIERRLGPEGAFHRLPAEKQDAFLSLLEDGGADLDGIPSKTFFQALLDFTRQGFFGDPSYGGNRGMAGWKLVGFPGAYSNYYDLVDRHGIAVKLPPVSSGEVPHGHAPGGGAR